MDVNITLNALISEVRPETDMEALYAALHIAFINFVATQNNGEITDMHLQIYPLT